MQQCTCACPFRLLGGTFYAFSRSACTFNSRQRPFHVHLGCVYRPLPGLCGTWTHLDLPYPGLYLTRRYLSPILASPDQSKCAFQCQSSSIASRISRGVYELLYSICTSDDTETQIPLPNMPPTPPQRRAYSCRSHKCKGA